MSGPSNTAGNVRVFDPLPIARPALPRIQIKPRPKSSLAGAALMPLFFAALFYLGGIILEHYVYLRPGLLLAGLLPLTAIAIAAIRWAPRMTWIALAAVWLTLGAWSGETEQTPAADENLTQLSNGLLRTVEGTVSSAEPMRQSEGAESNADTDRTAFSEPSQESMPSSSSQQIDLEVSSAEILSDDVDRMEKVAPGPADRIRLIIRWPVGAVRREFNCGEQLRAVIQMQEPEAFHDPGTWDRGTYLEARQISAIASVDGTRRDTNQPRLQWLDASHTNRFSCWLNQARNRAAKRLLAIPSLMRSFPGWMRAKPEDAAMLMAMLTGDRSFLTRSLRAGFEQTGSFHLIVVSGLHLAILAGCITSLARRLRLGRYAATASTLFLTLLYALLTGFGAPAQRSFWMIALYLVGRLIYRSRSPLNVIGFASLCVATFSPNSIFDASFQMTFLAVSAIAGIALPLIEDSIQARIRATKDLRLTALDPKLPPKIAQFRVALRMLARGMEVAISRKIGWKVFPWTVRLVLQLSELIWITFVVELALALPMAMYFHRITLYALPVNLVILPLLTLLVPSAMVLLLAACIWPAAAALPAVVCVGLLHASIWLVRGLGALTLADIRVPEPTPLQTGLAITLLVTAILCARWRWRGMSRLGHGLALAALALMAVTALAPRPVTHPHNFLLFEAIDVGQGDSLLLITPDGRSVLVDGGGLGSSFFRSSGRSGHSESESSFDTGEELVSVALWSRGIRRLDAVALTHAHHDHMGGLPAILRNFHPGELWIANNPPVGPYNSLLAEASTLGTRIRPLRAGQELTLDKVTFKVLGPDIGYHPGSQPNNNDSLVLRASYGATSLLLAGDAEAPEEDSILARNGSDLQSTVLKVGHHGSLTSTRPNFLSRVSPSWAVISCGRHNRFGHPRPEILKELQAAHVRTFRTDEDGAVCLSLDGKSVSADPACSESH